MTAQKKAGRKASAGRSRASRRSQATARLEEFGKRLEKETQDFVRYFNDEVVPTLRSQSSQAIRVAARRMMRFADYMDKKKRGSSAS